MKIAGKMYRRHAIALLLIFLITALLFALVGWFVARQHLNISSQELYRNLATQIVKENKFLYSNNQMIDQVSIKETFDRYMALNPALEIYQLDKKGNILAFSAEKNAVKKSRISTEPIIAFINNTRPAPILGEDPRELSKKKIFSATQLSPQNPEFGYLYVILRGEAVDSIERAVGNSKLIQRLLITTLLSLSGGLFIALSVFKWLGRPLESLTEKVSSASPTLTLSAPISKHPNDEVAALELSFNSMSDKIRFQAKEIQRQDRLRRRFIADISHDLRTPLAIVVSNLESLQLRFTRLTETEQLDHIKTAKRQTDLLAALIQDLFQLARLENPIAPIALETIHIGDLVQDVVHKHQILCTPSNIELLASVDSNLPLLEGQTELIERLLDNLITNAIAHTGEGGRIDVGVYKRNHKICISIADTGPGIAPENSQRVFTPGFSVSSKKNAGTGLGLAIAKRIASVHGGTLELTPSLKGARFEVRLPSILAY